MIFSPPFYFQINILNGRRNEKWSIGTDHSKNTQNWFYKLKAIDIHDNKANKVFKNVASIRKHPLQAISKTWIKINQVYHTKWNLLLIFIPHKFPILNPKMHFIILLSISNKCSIHFCYCQYLFVWIKQQWIKTEDIPSPD